MTITPLFDAQERLLVAPVVDFLDSSASNPWRRGEAQIRRGGTIGGDDHNQQQQQQRDEEDAVVWDYRLETTQQVQYGRRIQRARNTSKKLPSSSSFSSINLPWSPFPLSQKTVHQLIEEWNITRLQIQVASEAYSTYPSSPLDALDPLRDVLLLHRLVDDPLQGQAPWNSPSGVTVHVEFATNNPAISMVDDFVRVLKSLVQDRWVLAALGSSLESRRLHRYIQTDNKNLRQNTPSSSSSSSSSSSKTVNAVNQTSGIVLSVTLPTDGGAALSAEGMQSFLTKFLPCPPGTSEGTSIGLGLGGLYTATEWSNRLLGRTTPTLTQRRRRRGWWMELQSSCTCHNNNGNNNNSDQQKMDIKDCCSLSLSTGLYWSAPPPQPPDNNNNNKLDRTQQEESIGASDRLSWRDVLDHGKFSNDAVPIFSSCPVVRQSIVEVIMRTYNKNKNGQNMTTPTTRRSTFPSASLNNKKNNNSSSSSTTTTYSTDANEGVMLYKLYAHLERPNGPVNRGRFFTSFENNHVHCDATVYLQQALPRNLLTPIWQSLQVVVLPHDDDIYDNDDNNQNNNSTGRHRYVDPNNSNSNTITATTIAIAPRVGFLPHNEDFVLLSFNGTVPPQSRAQLVLEYEPTFLPSFEYFPGDANRGIELPPAQAQVTVPSWCRQGDDHFSMMGEELSSLSSWPVVVLFSESILFLPPLPDMSMPFNVLSLSCTLASFVIGAMINTLIRRGRDKLKYELNPQSKPKSLVKKLKDKIQAVFHKIKKRNQKSNMSRQTTTTTTSATLKEDDPTLLKIKME